MSSSNAADVGILANEPRPNNNNNGSTFEPEIITSRRDVYGTMAESTAFCGNCSYADIADGSTTSPALPPIIGLRINGVGNIALPISDHHGEEIKKRAINNEEHTSRGVYEIGADKIKIQNPQWGKSLGELLRTVAFKLGVNPRHLSALAKTLTLMEQGGYIGRKWDDDEEDDNVVGSLIIQLPSKFTGGELTIYNSSEDGNEESFKFTLGAGEKAAYSCHFACHFSDCEYEMAKLHSGSRLLLRYRLLYKEVDPMPTAGLIREKTSLITWSLNGLPPADRIVVVPLKKRYLTRSLAKSGINALNVGHRRKAESLKAARPNWEFVIVNAKLVHTCGYYGECTNVSTVQDIYDELGNVVNSSEMSWLKKSVDFECVAQDGMMLAALTRNEDECVSNCWGTGRRRDDPPYGYEESIYTATFLVSYDPTFKTELKCLGGCQEVAKIIEIVVNNQDYDLLDRVLAVVESKEKSKFDVKSCQILLQMLMKSKKDAPVLVTLANKILLGLSSSVEPDELLYDTIIDAVESFGHDGLGNVVDDLLNDAERRRGKDICFFLKRMMFALKMNKRIEGEAGLNYLDTTVNHLSLIFCVPSNSAAAVKSIMEMISTYDDMDLSNVVEACLNNLHRGGSSQSLALLINRAHLLKQLLATKKFGTLHTSLVEFVADFAQKAQSLHPSTSETKLKGESKSKFVQATAFLIEFGTQDDWDKFGKHIIKNLKLFSAFIDAVMNENRLELLRDILNKCLLQYSITNTDSSIDSWTVRKSGEPNILPTPSLHVQKILELYPSVVQTEDKDKRLPLHYATAYASASFDVTMEVFKAYEHAASIRDPATGLFPFQLAASNDNIEASFSLLLENPNLVSSVFKGRSSSV